MPLLVEMVGLPSVLTFWVSGYFYPIFMDPKYQHYFLLGLVAWLYTVGPRRSILSDVLRVCGLTLPKRKVKVL